jgi:hypothetical protein
MSPSQRPSNVCELLHVLTVVGEVCKRNGPQEKLSWAALHEQYEPK